MARERIDLRPAEQSKKEEFAEKLNYNLINKDNFKDLSKSDQELVMEILFEQAAMKVEVSKSLSTLEFLLFSFMRIQGKKESGLSMTATDKEIEDKLNQIIQLHELADEELTSQEWLLDYLGYAKAHSEKVIQNREDYINKKRNLMDDSE